ncbi:MAG: sulfide/dihydroorotate dehydrogenase-like FAD/NAD-binding protein [Christensenellales bacterium]|jgi:ferredoxin--NADP+ reductase
MYKILRKEQLAPSLFRMDIFAPRIAKKAMPGQFILLRVCEDGERIPLTIASFDRQEGSVSIIYQVVGRTTRLLNELNAGDSILDFVGPLGQPSHFEGERVLCIGGGVGTAVVYPQVKWLSENGFRVDAIQGARSKDYLILLDDLKAHTENLYITTDDGSYGRKGFVTDILKELLEKGEKYDMVVAIGPPMMMKFVAQATKPYGIKTMVSLNPVMIDGTGMCGGCRVVVGGQVKYACVDGPDFDGHLVDFDSMQTRMTMFRDHECRLEDAENDTE